MSGLESALSQQWSTIQCVMLQKNPSSRQLNIALEAMPKSLKVNFTLKNGECCGTVGFIPTVFLA